MTTALAAPRRTRIKASPAHCQFYGHDTPPDDLIPYYRWRVCPVCFRLITAESIHALGAHIGGPNPWTEQARTARAEMCFAALGVSPKCSEDELKEAWRAVVKAWHPDRPGGDHDMFIRMHEAYELACELRGFSREGAQR